MMTNGNDAAHGHGAENGHCCGLTKREYFVAMIAGIVAGNIHEPDVYAPLAVKWADALIAALNEEAK